LKCILSNNVQSFFVLPFNRISTLINLFSFVAFNANTTYRVQPLQKALSISNCQYFHFLFFFTRTFEKWRWSKICHQTSVLEMTSQIVSHHIVSQPLFILRSKRIWTNMTIFPSDYKDGFIGVRTDPLTVYFVFGSTITSAFFFLRYCSNSKFT